MITRLVLLFSSVATALAKQTVDSATFKPAFHKLHQISSRKSPARIFDQILTIRGGGYSRGSGNDDYGRFDDNFERGRYDDDRYDDDRYGARDDYDGDGYRNERDDAAPSKIPVGYLNGLLTAIFVYFSHAQKQCHL